MQRFAYGVLGLCLLFGSSGCYTTAVGGGPNYTAGTYSYISRDLTVVYSLALADVWPRALSAMETLQLHVDRQHIDGLGGNIEARRSDGTHVRVHLKPTGSYSTRVSVRVGDLGDRDHSERIQRTIRQQLNM